MDANVSSADGSLQRCSWGQAARSSNLREREMQVRQLRGAHRDPDGMTPWVT